MASSILEELATAIVPSTRRNRLRVPLRMNSRALMDTFFNMVGWRFGGFGSAWDEAGRRADGWRAYGAMSRHRRGEGFLDGESAHGRRIFLAAER